MLLPRHSSCTIKHTHKCPAGRLLQPRTAPLVLRHRRPVQPAQASSRPGPEYAALEAAVGAINKVLAVNNKIRGGGSSSNSSAATGVDQDAAQQRARQAREKAAVAVRADPGKLVTFRARASGSKEVTVSWLVPGRGIVLEQCLWIKSERQHEIWGALSRLASNDCLNPNLTRCVQLQEEFPGETGVIETTSSSSSSSSAATLPQPQPKRRDLRAYLSLPLEEYSLLDPRYIARLSEGGDSSSSSSSIPPTAGTGSSTTPSAAEGPLPASGAFLLTVPLVDIVGLDLTPQLVIHVEVDEAKGQVRSCVALCGDTTGVGVVKPCTIISCFSTRRADHLPTHSPPPINKHKQP